MILTALALASAMPTLQKKEVPDPLMSADANRDGVLTRDEVMVDAKARGSDAGAAKTLFDWGDRNRDGTLDAAERTRIYERPKRKLPPRPLPKGARPWEGVPDGGVPRSGG